MTQDFQMAHHDGDDWPEWGSAPRKPLVQLDMAHKGEWLESVIGPDVVTGKPMVYQIVRCELCIGIHAWPLPSPDALTNYYRMHFYQDDKPQMVERYEVDRRWWQSCVHGPILDAAQTFLRAAGIVEKVRMLDIGAGVGIALDCGKQRGWETWGMEPNAALCDALEQRGHHMLRWTLDTVASGPQLPTFHCLYLYETLEHVICPEEALLQCYEMLEPHGILVIVVPNDYSPIQLAAQTKLQLPPYWLAPPQHLFYWTPKTLQLLVRRCGFTIRMMRGTFPLDKFLLQDNYNYIGDDRIGRLVHGWRMYDELSAVKMGQWTQREQEYTMNMTQRIGREIICIAQKVHA